MNQKGLVPILIVLILAGIITFAPLPRYQQAMCNEMYPPICYPAGWKFGSSLWNELTGKTTQTVQKSIPSPLPTPTGETVYTELDRSANWKTYMNQKYKFSFKYPEGWIIKEETEPRRAFGLMSTTVSSPTKQSFIDIVVQTGTKEQIEKEKKELGNNATKGSLGNITVWVQKTGEISKIYSFPSIIEGQIINIVYGAVSDSPKSEIQAIDQILPTFKFLP